MASRYSFPTLVGEVVAEHVLECRINRPEKLNAINNQMWEDFREFFTRVAADPAVRVVLLTAAGKHFTAGLDLKQSTLMSPPSGSKGGSDVAHTALQIRRTGKLWQESFTSMEKCGKVVIALVHGLALGAGIEMVSAADIRLCTADARFRMAEVDIGLAADVGGLQRFPKIVGNQSLVRELALSGRDLGAAEALSMGLVSRLLPDRAALMKDGLELAKRIAAKSPVALLGVKTLLNYSRDHTVDESLEYAITWNQAMIQCKDLPRAAMSVAMKKTATFPDIPAARM